ncbi:MAG: hypothetical protein ABWK01_09395 [Infirmifilum sp.]
MRVLNAKDYQERWIIVFSDSNKWRAGIYIPENNSLEEIIILERHNRPELFTLLEGEMILVVSEDGVMIDEVPMRQGQIYIVEEWHNAYIPRGKTGKALVIEADDIETEYMFIKPAVRCRDQ